MTSGDFIELKASTDIMNSAFESNLCFYPLEFLTNSLVFEITYFDQHQETYEYIPGQAIRPVDPIVFDRIRVGFHQNPTSFIKSRSGPTRFLSDSFRSESGPDFIGIQRNAMKSDQIRSPLYDLGNFFTTMFWIMMTCT
jgi:hypothetical protein